MIGRSYSNIIKTFLSLLILSGLTVSLFSQDKQISGVVNVYRRVDAIGPGLDNVTLNNVDSISPGDTVLLIQMQGVEIVTDQNAYGGGVQDTIGKPGGYEFLLVQLVNSVTNKVVFRNNLLNTYDIKGSVQLVRVPYYNSATVTGMLTAKSWDNIEKTGGVLTMILGRKLKLNAEIDVSGKGFLGGKDTIGIGECVMTNPTDNNHDSYPRTWLNAGYKGEGLAIHDQFGTLLAPLHMKGQGINFTGGGGGNGKYSGGGGGSNRGKGGDGTFEKNLGVGSCPNFQPGAYGGTTVKATVILNGIFFGGGGGASTHAVGSTGSSGGNGGGIVIIIADTISGNSKSIKADGATAGNAISDAGAGGGGAGGSVVLSLQSFSNVSTDSLKISVKGGNGGTNAGGFGTGGGGGGGLLWVSTAAIPGKVPVKYNYGIPGPSSEGNGEIKYTFSPKLNGFLFNSIRSAVTGNQVDSICSNVTFGQITGTKPLGGVAPHSYLWQSSTTSEFFGYATASGISDGQNYFPGILTQSTWFRRVVKDSGGTILTDTSKAVRIIVQPFIKNNIVGNPDTICFSGDPQLIQQLVPALIVPTTKHLIFNWQDSTSSNIWGSPVALSENYDPPSGLGKTTWYRRTVTSGRCVDSTAIVKITVLPSITNDSILSLPQDICFGSTFTDLIATTAATTPAMAGGDNLYRFKWESNINGLGWGTAPGVSNGAGYNPAELPSKSPMNEYYFRRVVSSGIHDVCVDTSKSVLLKDFPVITNNTITANRTICSGSTPAKLIGSTPLNGNGIYTFTWQDSSKAHTWTIITGASLSDYQPAGLTDTTSYRRIVNSSACIDISKSITIIVHKPILNNNITLLAGGLIDTTICNGQVPHLLKSTVATGGTNIPGSYFYQWKFSTDNITFSPVPAGGTLVNFTPPALTTTTYYKREVTSGACTVISSSTIKVTVLPLITNNIISTNQTVCYNTQPGILTGAIPSGGGGAGTYTFFWEQSTDGTIWTPANGINDSPSGNYQPPALTVPMKYKRTVTSGSNGCCINTSDVVDITIHPPLPTGTITSTTDTTICEGSKVRLQIHLTGASKWKVFYMENSTQITINEIAGTDTTLLVAPVTGTSFTTFNYSLFSVEDKNGCIATSLTGTRKADVYKIPTANAGRDTVVCGAKITLNATPGIGSGTWYYPAAIVASTANNPSVTVIMDSTFTGSSIAHKFIWEEINWQCRNKDSVIITFYKRVSSINAGPDTSLFSFDNIIRMVADPLLAWETGLWTLVSGTGDFDDNSNNLAEVMNLSKGINTFLWRVTNGECNLEDSVNINVYDLVIPEGFSPNNDPGNYNNTFIITGLDLPNQIAELTIVNGAGTEVFSTTNIDGLEWTDWDGKNSKGLDLPEGTYYYLLKITSNGNSQVFKKSGFIVLKRY